MKKPMILGKTLIQRVYEACCKAVVEKKVIVATDSVRIKNFCLKNNISFLEPKKKLTTIDINNLPKYLIKNKRIYSEFINN